MKLVYIIRHPTNNYQYLKLVAIGATHWSEYVYEAQMFGTHEEAEEAAVYVASRYPWCLGKLAIEAVQDTETGWLGDRFKVVA